MLFNKYQIINDTLEDRGYSSIAQIRDKKNNLYFAKWLKGIQYNSQASKILFDKLRHLKKTESPIIIPIVEYNWDEKKKQYCIVSQYKKSKKIEEVFNELSEFNFLSGIKKIVEGLKKLHFDYGVTHGDITPANILLDEEENFYLLSYR